MKKNKNESKKDKQVAPNRPTQPPDLPPGSRGNLPPIHPEHITTQNIDLSKENADQSQA